MQRIQFKRNLVLTWMLSYVAILLISIICTGAIYSGYNNAFNSQVQIINQNTADSISENVRETLVGIRKIYFDLSFHSAVDSLPNKSSIDEYYKDKDIIQYVNMMINYGRYKNNVDMFYLYIPETDAVLSDKGIMDSKTFYQTFIEEPSTYEEWIAFLENATYQSYQTGRMRDAGGNYDAISCYMPIIKNFGETQNSNMVIVAAVERSRFLKGTSSGNSPYPYDVFVYDKSSNLILWQEELSVMENLPRTLTDVYDYGSDKSIICNTVSFDSITMTVATVFSQKVTLKNLEYVRYLFFIIIVIELIVSFLMIMFFVRRNYRPIREIMDLLGVADEKEGYGALRNSVEEVLRQNNVMTWEMDKQKSILERTELARFMYGRPAAKNMESLQKLFREEYYAAVIFSAHRIESMFNDEVSSNEEKRRDLYFIISNVMEELLNTEESVCYVVDMGEEPVGVVNFKEKNDQTVYNKLLYGLHFIEDQFNVKISIAMSSAHESLSGIFDAYFEAMQMANYKKLFRLENNMRYRDVFRDEEAMGDYPWTLDREQQLLRYLNTGNYEMSEVLLRRVFAEISEIKGFSFDYMNVLFTDIASVFLKIGTKKPVNYQFSSNNYSADELLELFLQECREICKNVTEDKSKGIRQCEDVMLYVQEHYTDPALCCDSIGAAFQMTGAYLSKIFKDETGKSLVNYISEYRLEKSKELIRTTRLNLNTISEMVGFNHTRTYNRLFKKYEGMTPSTYKERFRK